MKYSYKWLQELSGTQKTAQELADFLTMRTFEVESVEEIGFDTENVIIGEVMELVKHPNADRLRVAQINVGSETLQIVCGAPNIEVGQKVPVAMVGAKLPGNFEIKESEIRDVTSYGMVCSQKELGLGGGHEGIFVLPEAAVSGDFLRDFLNDSDFLLDIKVLPDRAHDALSHVGMAREIVALEEGELDYDYESLVLPESESKAFTVSIQSEGLSKRYIGALIRDIEVKASPIWLQNRLKKLGIRSINNVVDVTNFVMLELGQPLHSFDWDIMAEREDGSKGVDVRFAEAGETAALLDGKTYTLSGEDIVIADGAGVLAVAGVMGGKDSGVTGETKSIFLEGAHFDSVSIRKTRTKLGIRTDASDRFEKDLDPNLAEKAMVRALELLAHIAKGSDVAIVDVYPDPFVSRVVPLPVGAAQKLLGIDISAEDIEKILPRLGCRVKRNEQDVLDVTVPTYRLDIDSAEDLIEEVGKMIGYDVVPVIAPKISLTGVTQDGVRLLQRKLQDSACANGFTEVLNYAFYSRQDAEATGMGDVSYLELANPMNPDQALMRASLLPHMLRNIRENLKHQKSLQLFESGNVYYASEFQAVHESQIFAGSIVLEKNDAESFFVLKGMLERMLHGIGIVSTYDTTESVGQYWHPTRTGDIFGVQGHDAIHIGRIGEIHPFVLEYFQIKKRVAYFELDYASLQKLVGVVKSFVPMNRYPEVLRDISIFVPATVRVKDIIDGINKKSQGLVLGVELFDQYFDEEKNMKSLAFHIHFGAMDRTLEGTEADALLEKITASLEKTLKVARRV
ncbi:MAG: phenylalanine--tRNA ligase subunit beta [Candidatus Moranbacteria bacterium]|nr:phenylalanine--tRNA ligase subunit beta [Candidatus Moranbacteria bacterium]